MNNFNKILFQFFFNIKNSDRMKSLKEFLNESRIGKISKTFKIDIRLEKTVHADERQSRHGTSADKFISDVLFLFNCVLTSVS